MRRKPLTGTRWPAQKFEQSDPVMPPMVKSVHISPDSLSPGLSGSGYT
jgi:hypothetical protein